MTLYLNSGRSELTGKQEARDSEAQSSREETIRVELRPIKDIILAENETSF